MALKRRKRSLGATETTRSVEEKPLSAHEEAIIREHQPVEVSSSALHPHPLNRGLDEEHVRALMNSVAAVGQLTPIIVRPHPEIPDAYLILSGHHRWEALRRLRMRAKVVIYAPTSRLEELRLLAEANAQRELDFISKAEIAKAMHEQGMSIEDIAEVAPTLGAPATVHIMVSFFHLPPRIQELARKAHAGPAVVRALTQLVKGGDKWRKRAERLLARGARAADFERAVAEMQAEHDQPRRTRYHTLFSSSHGYARYIPGKTKARVEIVFPAEHADAFLSRLEEVAKELLSQPQTQGGPNEQVGTH